MAVQIEVEDMPDFLRGLRELILAEQAKADAAQAAGKSSWAQIQNGVRHLEAKLRKYDLAYEKAQS
jgi:hypothetical protein